jgi:tetratricopeptide (TPR) repeat protein
MIGRRDLVGYCICLGFDANQRRAVVAWRLRRSALRELRSDTPEAAEEFGGAPGTARTSPIPRPICVNQPHPIPLVDSRSDLWLCAPMRLVLVAVILATLAPAAHADVATAKKAYEKGMMEYNLQQFGDALEMFRRAYQEKLDPVFLYNIGQCQRQLAQYEAAAKSYRAYLASSSETPANADQVRGLINDMERAAQEQRAAKPPTGTVAPSPVAVTAPAQVATVESAPKRWYQNPLGWSLVGVGVASLAVSIGMFAHENSLNNQLGSAMSIVQAQQLQADRDTYKTAGIATVAIGGAAAVAGVVVLAVMARRHPRTTAWIVPSASGSGVMLAGGGVW